MSNLTFIKNTSNGKGLYLCVCGNYVNKWKSNVRNGSVTSCGCINRRLQNKLSKLLDGSLESFYWLGFLFADGHFTNLGRLTITLSSKDAAHLNKFNEFVGSCGNVRECGTKVRFSVNDIETIQTIMMRYGLNQNKTYYPPALLELQGDERTAFFIGFIDGDGSIQYQTGRKDCRITIKLHSSWLSWLEDLMETPCHLNSSGYAYGCIASNAKLKHLKTFVINNKLPALSRKWDKIDLDFVNRTELSNIRKPVIFDMYENGYSIKDISTLLEMKYSAVYHCLKRGGKL